MGRPVVDLTNQYFGKLKVKERDLSKPIGKENFAYWLCECECGNIVSVRGDHLRDNTTQSCGCINSKGEFLIRQILDQLKIKYKQQYIFSDLKVKKSLRFDFAIFDDNNNIKCLIEYQGQQHFQPYHFDTDERFQKRLEYDRIKREYCKENNIKLIEISYIDYEKINKEYILKLIE